MTSEEFSEEQPEKPKRAGKNTYHPDSIKLTAAELKRVEKIKTDALFITHEQKACVHLSMEVGRDEAAKKLGWTPQQVNKCLKLPHVKLYALKYSEIFMKHMAQHRVNSLRKVGVTRDSVNARLMEIALMSPDETKNNVLGQVKALEQLSSNVGLGRPDPLGEKTDEELEAIVKGAQAKIPTAPGSKTPQ